MELTQAQYERIAPHLPVQRGNVSLSNQQVLNAILYVAEHGCKWRGLPARFGNWHTLYTRMNRWSKNGVLDRVFEHLQREQIVRVKLEAVSLDSTIVQVHPDGTGALKKRGLYTILHPIWAWCDKRVVSQFEFALYNNIVGVAILSILSILLYLIDIQYMLYMVETEGVNRHAHNGRPEVHGKGEAREGASRSHEDAGTNPGYP